jgi:hypothetical protein
LIFQAVEYGATLPFPLQFLLPLFFEWVNRPSLKAIEYLKKEPDPRRA